MRARTLTLRRRSRLASSAESLGFGSEFGGPKRLRIKVVANAVNDFTTIRAATRLIANQRRPACPSVRSPGHWRTWSAGLGRRGSRGQGAQPGGAPRWSCPCRPSRKHGPDRKSRARPMRLVGMQEDRPLLPREVERALKFLGIGQNAKAALRVRVRERIGVNGHRFRALPAVSPTASFSKASWASCGRCAMTSNSVSSSAVRTSSTHSSGTPKSINSNLRRFPNSFCFGVRSARRPASGRKPRSPARARVPRRAASRRWWDGVRSCAARPICRRGHDGRRRPARAGCGAVDDHPDVRAYANRPEILILGAVELVERQPGR